MQGYFFFLLIKKVDISVNLFYMVRLSSVLLTKVNLVIISMCLLESKDLGSTGDEGQLPGGDHT